MGTLGPWAKAQDSSSSSSLSETQVVYARCNLKVLDGKIITWVNWQASPTFIPVGTELRVLDRNGPRALIEEVKRDKSYSLDMGADGDQFLEKFVSKNFIDINNFPEDVQENIRNAVARIGMTKEQVYVAMGPPAWVGENTNLMTYDQIMNEDLWVFKRRRFGKNIGVSFDPFKGLVNRTEGIWR